MQGVNRQRGYIKDRPTAIFCYNDEAAISVAGAIRESNFSFPEDILLIGYDDSTLASATETKLTTVKHPKKKMGRLAAEFVIDIIEGRDSKPYMIFEPELVIRDSTREI